MIFNKTIINSYYRRRKDELTFWRTLQGNEVDFIVGRHTAIEVKATKKTSQSDLKGLRVLQEEGIFKKLILVSQDPLKHEKAGILCLPYKDFLTNLWLDNIF